MSKKPNILILMADQHRADSLGCAGHPIVKTPNIDRIAQQGIRFDKAYTVCPICMPARASFVSGLYPHNHQMWGNAGKLPEDDETFFHYLQRSGYFTAHVGKSHYYPHSPGTHLMHHEDYMHARGLDYVHETTGPWATLWTQSYMTDHWKMKGLLDVFIKDYGERRRIRGKAELHEKKDKLALWPSHLPEEEFIDSYIGQKAIEFIQAYSYQYYVNKQPLCLFVGFGGPHEPFDPPGKYASMYDSNDIPDPIPEGKPGNWVPKSSANRLDSEKTAKDLTRDQLKKAAANYFGKISLIDSWIGRIVSDFENLEGAENTFVVFWSDHGEMLGDHNCLYKQVFYESSVRVPLIISWPGHVKGGKNCDALVELIDIFPTLTEIAGSEPSERCLGRSLWDSLQDPQQQHRDAVFSEIYSFNHRNIMVRTDRYKYAADETGMGYMLFDVVEDPSEQKNLIGHPDMKSTEEKLSTRVLSFLIEKQLQRTHSGEGGRLQRTNNRIRLHNE